MGAAQCHFANSVTTAHEADGDPDGRAMVFINVYDLNEELRAVNNIVSDIMQIGGAFHAGLEIHGQEWSYGEDGVLCYEPRHHEVHVYRQSISMGTTLLTEQEVKKYMEEVMMGRWDGDDYHVLRCNCCSFVDEACRNFTGRALPSWVNRLARFAVASQFDLESLADLGNCVAAPSHGNRHALGEQRSQTKDSAASEETCHSFQTKDSACSANEACAERTMNSSTPCQIRRVDSRNSITTATGSSCSSLEHEDLAEP
eukprot:TRINITY_DN59290_c0_g1_i1.p1 TRINITY_DN59290_c0_g1~~TRINITY_DN59290_c0_g1_i1.p1  ORF type:complete len:257 (+),score=41.26 TRINITY_DN59290_c0_g1_i1:79-849(+)